MSIDTTRGADRPMSDPLPQPPLWSARSVIGAYWRAPVIGIIAGLLAFVGSFVVSPTYAAGSRVLVRGHDTTLLSGSGAPLSDNGTLIDSQLATVLSSTNAALLGSNDIAAQIVDQLHLDAPRPKPQGVIGKSRRFASDLYKRSRAILTHGFYKTPPPRDAAIEAVRAGLGAKQVEDSYVIEIAGTADDPVLAAAIANAAADALVAQSASRSSEEATAYRTFLAEQVAVAQTDVDNAAAALAAFKAEHGLADSASAQLSAEQAEGLKRDLATAQADLAAAQARSAELDAQLAATNPLMETSNKITTGRSETDVAETAPNPAYAAILNSSQEAKADVARLDARVVALQSLLSGEQAKLSTGPTTALDEQLRSLEVTRQLADQTLAALNTQYQQAVVNAAHRDVELTRLDVALPPTYPVGPKRYLYLAIGLFVGALVGFVWSHLRVSRRERLARWESSLTQRAVTDPQPLIDLTGAGQGNGAPNGAPLPARAGRPAGVEGATTPASSPVPAPSGVGSPAHPTISPGAGDHAAAGNGAASNGAGGYGNGSFRAQSEPGPGAYGPPGAPPRGNPGRGFTAGDDQGGPPT